MAFEIPPDHKFALIALEGPLVRDALSYELQVAPGVWVFPESPLDIDEWWGEGVGSFDLRHYKDSHLYLLTTAHSATPGVFDAENQALIRHLHGFLQGLLTCEAVRYSWARMISGAREGERAPNPRQYSFLPACYPQSNTRHLELDDPLAVVAHNVGQAILAIYHQVPHLLAPTPRLQAGTRLRRGFNALLDGLRQRDGAPRLHAFVRALEGLVHPRRGNSERQWVHRCQTLAGHHSADVLSEMYQLRSAEEHLNDFRDVLENPAATLRVFQAEVLACSAFRRIFENPTLRTHFRNDNSIAAFWRSRTPGPQRLWGQPTDIREGSLRASRRIVR